MAIFQNPFRLLRLQRRDPAPHYNVLNALWPWWASGFVLPAGPLLLAVAKFLDMTGPGMSTAAYLEKVAANRAGYVMAGFFLMAGFLVTALASGAIFLRTGSVTRPGLLRRGAVMVGAGCVLAVPTAAQSFAVGHLLANDARPNLEPESVEAIFLGINGSPWAMAFGIGSLMLQAAGFTCLALGLWQTRLVPRPLALLPFGVLLGWAVSGTFQNSAPTWTAAIPNLLLAISFGAIAANLPRMRSSR